MRTLLLSAAICAALSSPANAAGIAHRWNCIQEVLGISMPPPEVAMLKRSEFRERFGRLTGYYDSASGTVYISSATPSRTLVHELGHHAGLRHGDAELALIERVCANGGARPPVPSVDGDAGWSGPYD